MKIRSNKLLDIKSPLFPTRLSLLACVVLAIGGILFGILEKSLAVQTNGFIAAIEILNSLLFLAAVNQSVRLPDVTYNFGYGKYESLAMLFGTVLLSVILIITLISAVKSFGEPIPIGNYYLLLAFSICSYITIRTVSKYLKSAAKKFFMPLLDYDADAWRNDSYIELCVILNLIFGAILGYFNMEKLATHIDSTTAIILVVFSLRVPITHGKDALNQLLDRTLPETMQFDIIAVIAENINRMCEFKSTSTRRSGKDIFIEIDVVMPYDFTLEEAFKLEKDIHNSIKEKYPTAIPRLYATPCLKDCIYENTTHCPVKLALNANVENQTKISDSPINKNIIKD